MKKSLIVLFISAAALFAPTGCVKSDLGSNGNPLSIALQDIPNLSSFVVQATSAFVAGAEGLIHVFSSTLGDGVFTVKYTLSGNNTFSGTATLTMSGGTGTFSTPVMGSAGPTTATITSVSNAAGHSSTPATNNVSSMFDSSGYMGANYTTKTGANTQFTTNQVTTQLAGSLLTINGVMWLPTLTTIAITDFNYSGVPGVVNAFGGAGGVSYGEAGSVVVSEISTSGSFTITTTSPLLTGTFSVKNADQSTVTGTFSCPAP